MGYVMQEPLLFNYNILENILYGFDNATNSQVREAAKVANALEFIEKQGISIKYEDKASDLLRGYKENLEEVKEIIGEELYKK